VWCQFFNELQPAAELFAILCSYNRAATPLVLAALLLLLLPQRLVNARGTAAAQ